MGNIIATIKKFLQNKNTVTILAVLAGIIVLWYFYNRRVEEAITTIRIPYAIAAVDSTDKIEGDNIGFKEITQVTTKDSDIITSTADLDGKYVCIGTSIPRNGFFYKSQICDLSELPNSIAYDIKEGYGLFNMSVNSKDTYGNSISPGDRIDIYMSTSISGGRVWGKLIESIEVKAVKDSSGRNVHWDSDAGDTAYLIFELPENVEGQDNLFELLNMTTYISGIELKPILRGHSYTQNPGDTNVSSEVLRRIITDNYVDIDY